MKKINCALIFGAVLSLMAGAGWVQGFSASAGQAARGSDIEAKVDAYVKPYLDIKAFNGAILIARGGRVLLAKGFGMANYELDVPNTPRTKFHIASISKTFTAAAVMILEERGALKVQDPLSKYLPDYPNGEKMTIHHLLVHTSGIPNVNNFPEYEQWSRFPQTPASLIGFFKNRPLNFEPGARYEYSNSNYNVLAFIVEKASGRSYGDFLRESIFDPLGMKDTAHDGDAAALVRNAASGYTPAGYDGLEKTPYLDWTIKTGNGSIYTTIGDLYAWDRALYSEKILSRASLESDLHPPRGWIRGLRMVHRQAARPKVRPDERTEPRLPGRDPALRRRRRLRHRLEQQLLRRRELHDRGYREDRLRRAL